MEELDTSTGYHVHIKQFDGPLDLLLFLIEKAEVDIREVFVSEITSEFLNYLSELDELDMDQASSFITVAATLVYMKSRSLMPKPRSENDDEEEEDPGEALIRRYLLEMQYSASPPPHAYTFMRPSRVESRS